MVRAKRVKRGILAVAAGLMMTMGGQEAQAASNADQYMFNGFSEDKNLGPLEMALYREDRLYVRGLMRDETPTSLNYADPRQYRFVLSRLKLAGKSPKNSPHLFKLIAQRRAEHLEKGYEVGMTLTAASNGRKTEHFLGSTNFLSDTSAVYEVKATCTHPNAAYYIWCDAAAWDNNGEPLGAMGFSEVYGAPYTKAASHGDTSLSAATSFESDTYTFKDTPEGLIETYSVRRGQGRELTYAATVQKPVTAAGDQTCADICLNRTWTGDCDYDMTGTPGSLTIPLQGTLSITAPAGNAAKFDVATIDLYKQGALQSPGYIKVVLPTAGGGCDVDSQNSISLPMQEFWQSVTVINDPNGTPKTIAWDFNATFDQTCRLVQAQLELTMFLAPPVLWGNSPISRPVVITNDATAQNPLFQLPCITVTNSCLAAGTKVQMANGKPMPIESVKVGDRVANPFIKGGKSLTVMDTAKGFEDVMMVRIEDEKGKELLLTQMHPVSTKNKGMVLAKYLEKGDTVLTQSGPSKLMSVQREDFGGSVYNLKLGSDEEKGSLGEDQTVLFANGFLVGDGQIQNRYEFRELSASTQGDVRARLPKRWHRDYRNSTRR